MPAEEVSLLMMVEEAVSAVANRAGMLMQDTAVSFFSAAAAGGAGTLLHPVNSIINRI
jgi:hypothetical protein